MGQTYDSKAAPDNCYESYMPTVTLTVEFPQGVGIYDVYENKYAEVFGKIDLSTESSISYAARAFCSNSDLPFGVEERDQNFNWLITEATNHCISTLNKNDIDIFTFQSLRLHQLSAKYEMGEYKEIAKPSSLSISKDLFENLTEQAAKYNEAITIFEKTETSLRKIISGKPTANSTNREEAGVLLSYLSRISRESNASYKDFDCLKRCMNELYNRQDTKNHNYQSSYEELSSKLMCLTKPTVFYSSPTPYPKS